jgi:hypothetical protein
LWEVLADLQFHRDPERLERKRRPLRRLWARKKLKVS